jgi:hypothetical protein
MYQFISKPAGQPCLCLYCRTTCTPILDMDTSVSRSESIPVFDEYDSSPTFSVNNQQVIDKELPEHVLNIDYNLQNAVLLPVAFTNLAFHKV